MKETNLYLLAQRSDGKFLRLDEQRHTTDFDYVDKPELAKRIIPYIPDGVDQKEYLKNLQPAPYYFENSWRAREYWLKDCKMVCYRITNEVIAEPYQE